MSARVPADSGLTGVAILGATGSVGRATLDVLARHPQRYQVVALSGHANMSLLAQQCRDSGAAFAVTSDPARESELRAALRDVQSPAQVIAGPGALLEMVQLPQAQVVMAAIVGAAGLPPTLEAVRLGKRVLLANKESMVIAGALFERTAQASGAEILPVDSEHNALLQALPPDYADGLAAAGVEKLVLTASGGPFLDRDARRMESVTPEQACAHPRWNMGPKISVDSATLMNKGLELIEARWLFKAQASQLEVVIHPQSVVHSMVVYRDGSVLAQLGLPDMRTPIACALAWPQRISSGVAAPDFAELGALSFARPDLERFPCLRLAQAALAAEGDAPVVLNAANEVAVAAFLERRIGFTDIPRLVERALEGSGNASLSSLDAIQAVDAETRARVGEWLPGGGAPATSRAAVHG